MTTGRDGWTVRNKQTHECFYFSFEERCLIRHLAQRAEEEDWDAERWMKNFRAEIKISVSDEYLLGIRHALQVWDVREVAMPK